MIKKIILNFALIFSALYFIFGDGCTKKQCDEIQNSIDANQEKLKPTFYEVNPEIHKYTVVHNGFACYEFKFIRKDIFKKYELSLGKIKFEFTLETDNCIMSGDIVTCWVDKQKFAEECYKQSDAYSRNSYDCIYHPSWLLKVRGFTTCQNQNYYGPSSDSLTVSLQCLH